MKKLILAAFVSLTSAASFGEHRLGVELMDVSRATAGEKAPIVNRSAFGGPMKVGEYEFWVGFGMCAPTKVSIPIGKGCIRFESEVAVDDRRPDGRVAFKVWADGKLVADSGVLARADGKKKLVADLTGSAECVLEVTDGAGGATGGLGDWINCEFFYEDGRFPPNDVRNHSRQLGILTPKERPEPRINGATVYGVRPGRPVLWRLPVTGERPMKIAAAKVPEGLSFDPASQVLSGVLPSAGDYRISFTASNAKGTCSRDLLVRVGDTISLTPAMGWNSWNCFTQQVSAEKVKSAADAMIASGLADHGWSYITVDDFWQTYHGKEAQYLNDRSLAGPAREADGTIVVNARFGSMKALADYIHAKGLKAGLYSSPGPYTCGSCTGSYGHELQDAATYAAWGFDFLKYDWCSYGDKAFGKDHWRWAYPYWIMGNALKAQDRDIVFSLCEYGVENVSAWGNLVHGQSWRTTGDVFDTWRSISEAIELQRRLFMYSKPGAWNDPDMLCVGKMSWNGFAGSRLAPNEQYTHISIWALVGSPLMIGCDMTRLDDFTYSLLSNDEVIAIDQDPLGAGAGVVAEGPDWEIWARPLANGSIAAGLYNKSDKEQQIVFDMESLGLECKWTVRDVWVQEDVGVFLGRYSASVPGHATHLVTFTPRACGKLRAGLLDIRDNAWNLLMTRDGKPQ
jgi:alpha-galactosidase